MFTWVKDQGVAISLVGKLLWGMLATTFAVGLLLVAGQLVLAADWLTDSGDAALDQVESYR